MIRVSDIMTRDVVSVDKSKKIIEAEKLMKAEGISSLIVLDTGNTVGIITENDIVCKIVAEALNPKRICVGEITSKPLVMINYQKELEDAARLMRDNKIKKLAVSDGEKIVGILTEYDLIIAEPALHLLLSK